MSAELAKRSDKKHLAVAVYVATTFEFEIHRDRPRRVRAKPILEVGTQLDVNRTRPL